MRRTESMLGGCFRGRRQAGAEPMAFDEMVLALGHAVLPRI
ncbi:hypothetical protein AB0I10_38180 [Streptomyces sp. NPDC050636]